MEFIERRKHPRVEINNLIFYVCIGVILYFAFKDTNGKKRVDETKNGSELPENSVKENILNE